MYNYNIRSIILKRLANLTVARRDFAKSMKNKGNLNIILVVVICLVLVGVLVFISVNNKEDMAENNNVVLEEGVAKVGDVVSMNYTGRLQDGTVFDSNIDPKFNHVEPFFFTLGAGQVIAGWDKGIIGMKAGEKKTLTIAPEDGYGVNGAGNVIPPNATLIFEVELLKIN